MSGRLRRRPRPLPSRDRQDDDGEAPSEGLGEPVELGPPGPNVVDRPLPLLGERTLATPPGTPAPPH